MNEERLRPDDHIRGNPAAPVTLIEYADFQCPFSARAYRALRDLHAQLGDKFCLAYRHLPLADKHPFAEFAAEAAEVAGAQGKFWEMHDALFDYQELVDPDELPSLAQGIGLDVDRFRDDMVSRGFRERVLDDAAHARALGADSTPTFFINGQRYHGNSNRHSLEQAIRAALAGADRPS